IGRPSTATSLRRRVYTLAPPRRLARPSASNRWYASCRKVAGYCPTACFNGGLVRHASAFGQGRGFLPQSFFRTRPPQTNPATAAKLKRRTTKIRIFDAERKTIRGKTHPIIERNSGGGPTVKILIAEDERVSRRLLELTLTGWGHEVIVTEQGEEAWAILEQ